MSLAKEFAELSSNFIENNYDLDYMKQNFEEEIREAAKKGCEWVMIQYNPHWPIFSSLLPEFIKWLENQEFAVKRCDKEDQICLDVAWGKTKSAWENRKN